MDLIKKAFELYQKNKNRIVSIFAILTVALFYLPSFPPFIKDRIPEGSLLIQTTT